MKLNLRNLRKFVLPLLLLLLACFFAMGSSPVFKTNPWGDSNAMLTMGRSILHGMVPYQGIVDQRGPLLYALFAIGAMINGDSFLGVFILEVINAGIIYFLSYRIAKDLKVNIAQPQWAGLLGPLALLGTSAYIQGGAPEEFAFTSILYLLYVINHYRQKVEDVPLKTFFLLGINFSLIFWNKYSLSGTFVFFFIWTALMLLYKKQFKLLLKVIVVSVLGFMIISSIVWIYFSMHHATSDLIQIYFVKNLTSYGTVKQSRLMQLWSLLQYIGFQLKLHYIVFTLIVLGWFEAIFSHKNVTLEVVLFGAAILFVALQRRVNDYNTLIWMVFLVVALLRLLRFRKLHIEASHKYATNLIIVGCLFFLPFANNTYLGELVVKGNPTSFNKAMTYTAQPTLAKEMRKEVSGNPSIIQVNDLDGGFYLAAKTVPTTKYWQLLNMTYTQFPEMYRYFAKTFDQKKVDFVIVRLFVAPEKSKLMQQYQVKASVDKSIYPSLKRNYKIDMTAQNGPGATYILLKKK